MKLPAYVYELKHETTGKAYIGISHNPKRRLNQHLCLLRRGRHPVEDLQTDYNKHGEMFSFRILEEVLSIDKRSREFAWQLKLRTLERHRGYNYKDPVTNWCLPIPEHPETEGGTL